MKKKILLLFILFGAFLFFSVPASAVLFELDTTYSGAEPSGALLARIDNVSPIDVGAVW